MKFTHRTMGRLALSLLMSLGTEPRLVSAQSCPTGPVGSFRAGDFAGNPTKLLVFEDTLCAFGSMRWAGSVDVAGTAAWRNGTWKRFDESLVRSSGRALDVAFWGEKLVMVSNGFHTGVHSNELVMWDGTQWQTLLPSSVFAPDNVAANGQELAVSDFFDWDIGSGTVFVRANDTWKQLPSPRGDIQRITYLDGALVLQGGQFGFDPDRFGPGAFIVRWDGSEWENLDYPGANPNTMFASGSSLYVIAREWNDLPGVDKPTVWQFDGATWTPLPSRTTDGFPYGMGMYKGELIVGGAFTSIGGVPARGIARWDGQTWRPFGAGLGVESQTGSFTFVEWQGTLVAGGNFLTAGKRRANCIARWDGHDWHTFETIGDGIAFGALTAVGYKGDLYVGGGLIGAGDIVAEHVARWDGMRWHDAGINQPSAVNNLLVAGGSMYAAGGFAGDGDPFAPYQDFVLARFDDPGWSVIRGLFGYARESYPIGTGVAVIGSLLDDHGDHHRLAVWDGKEWSFPEYPFGRAPGPMVQFNGKLVAAYGFHDADGNHQFGLAEYHNNTWTPMSPAPPMSADDLIVVNGVMYLLQNSRVYRFDGNQWATLPEITPGAYCKRLGTIRGQLLAIGGFAVTLPGGGREFNSFAVWDGSAWHPTMGSQRTDQLAVAVVEHDTTMQLYTIGEFALPGASPQHRIARYETCRCACDANFDGAINGVDLSILLSRFGKKTDNPYDAGDTSGDALVNAEDLARLLNRFGNTCQ